MNKDDFINQVSNLQVDVNVPSTMQDTQAKPFTFDDRKVLTKEVNKINVDANAINDKLTELIRNRIPDFDPNINNTFDRVLVAMQLKTLGNNVMLSHYCEACEAQINHMESKQRLVEQYQRTFANAESKGLNSVTLQFGENNLQFVFSAPTINELKSYTNYVKKTSAKITAKHDQDAYLQYVATVENLYAFISSIIDNDGEVRFNSIEERIQFITKLPGADDLRVAIQIWQKEMDSAFTVKGIKCNECAVENDIPISVNTLFRY